MNAILSLPGWKVIGVVDSGQEIHIRAEAIKTPIICTKCGSTEAKQKGKKLNSKFRDIPFRGKPVVLHAVTRKYNCGACGTDFIPHMKGIQRGTRHTERCHIHILEQCRTRLAEDIAVPIGVKASTVTVIMKKERSARRAVPKHVPKYLGLDVVPISGAARMVLTDIQTQEPVDILRTRNPSAIAQWIADKKAAGKVDLIALDIDSPFRAVLRKHLPQATLVASKLSVLKLAEEAMQLVVERLEATRNANGMDTKFGTSSRLCQAVIQTMRARTTGPATRTRLDLWESADTEFTAALQVKEALYDWYEAATDQDAAAGLDQWRAFAISALTPNAAIDFASLLDATEQWREEILASFKHEMTNGFTDAYRGLVSCKKRPGRALRHTAVLPRLVVSQIAVRQRDARAALGYEDAQVDTRTEEQAALCKQQLSAQGGACGSCSGHYPAALTRMVSGLALCMPCAEREHLITTEAGTATTITAAA